MSTDVVDGFLPYDAFPSRSFKNRDLAVPRFGRPHDVRGGNTKPVRSVAFSADGRWIATGSDLKGLRVWDVRNTGAAASGPGAAGGAAPGHGVSVDVASSTPLPSSSKTPSPHGGNVAALAWSPTPGQEHILISGCKGAGGGGVAVWDVTAPSAPLASFKIAGDIMHLAFHPSGEHFAAVCPRQDRDEVFFFWRREVDGEEKWQQRTDVMMGGAGIDIGLEEINSLRFWLGGDTVLAVSNDGSLNAWWYPLDERPPLVFPPPDAGDDEPAKKSTVATPVTRAASAEAEDDDKPAEVAEVEREAEGDADEGGKGGDGEGEGEGEGGSGAASPTKVDDDRSSPVKEMGEGDEDDPMAEANGETKDDDEPMAETEGAPKGEDVEMVPASAPVSAPASVPPTAVPTAAPTPQQSAAPSPSKEVVEPTANAGTNANGSGDANANGELSAAAKEAAAKAKEAAAKAAAVAELARRKHRQLERCFKTAPHVGSLLALAVEPNGRYFAIGGGDARVSLLDAEHWLVERNYDAPTATIRHIAFSADGELLAVGGDDPCIYIISVHTRATLHKIPVVGMVNSLAWHPGRNCLAWSTKQPSAVVWYLANQE